jgi:hypothetical protein
MANTYYAIPTATLEIAQSYYRKAEGGKNADIKELNFLTQNPAVPV